MEYLEVYSHQVTYVYVDDDDNVVLYVDVVVILLYQSMTKSSFFSIFYFVSAQRLSYTAGLQCLPTDRLLLKTAPLKCMECGAVPQCLYSGYRFPYMQQQHLFHLVLCTVLPLELTIVK